MTVPAIAEHNVRLQLEETEMETWIFQPDDDGAYPAVIMYMDAQSLRDELRRIAKAIAAKGYVVAVFDLYHRFGEYRPHLRTRDAKVKTAMRAMVVAALSHVEYPYVMKDTQAVIEFLDQQPFVSDAGIATLGFCFSGRFALIAAAQFSDRVKAAVSLFGTQQVTGEEDSPHLQAKGIKGEVYLGFAGLDRYVDQVSIETLSASLAEEGVVHEVDVIDDADHGFCFMDGGHVYSESASNRAWNKIFALFEKTLQHG